MSLLRVIFTLIFPFSTKNTTVWVISNKIIAQRINHDMKNGDDNNNTLLIFFRNRINKYSNMHETSVQFTYTFTNIVTIWKTGFSSLKRLENSHLPFAVRHYQRPDCRRVKPVKPEEKHADANYRLPHGVSTRTPRFPFGKKILWCRSSNNPREKQGIIEAYWVPFQFLTVTNN